PRTARPENSSTTATRSPGSQERCLTRLTPLTPFFFDTPPRVKHSAGSPTTDWRSVCVQPHRTSARARARRRLHGHGDCCPAARRRPGVDVLAGDEGSARAADAPAGAGGDERADR